MIICSIKSKREEWETLTTHFGRTDILQHAIKDMFVDGRSYFLRENFNKHELHSECALGTILFCFVLFPIFLKTKNKLKWYIFCYYLKNCSSFLYLWQLFWKKFIWIKIWQKAKSILNSADQKYTVKSLW